MRRVVSASLRIAEDISTFDQTAFRGKVATTFSVPQENVTVRVEPASLRATVNITVMDATASETAVRIFNGDIEGLGRQLEVSLQEVEDVASSLQVVQEFSPATPVTHDAVTILKQERVDVSPWAWIAAGTGIAFAVVLCAMRRRRLRLRRVTTEKKHPPYLNGTQDVKKCSHPSTSKCGSMAVQRPKLLGTNGEQDDESDGNESSHEPELSDSNSNTEPPSLSSSSCQTRSSTPRYVGHVLPTIKTMLDSPPSQALPTREASPEGAVSTALHSFVDFIDSHREIRSGKPRLPPLNSPRLPPESQPPSSRVAARDTLTVARDERSIQSAAAAAVCSGQSAPVSASAAQLMPEAHDNVTPRALANLSPLSNMSPLAPLPPYSQMSTLASLRVESNHWLPSLSHSTSTTSMRVLPTCERPALPGATTATGSSESRVANSLRQAPAPLDGLHDVGRPKA